MLAQVLAQGLGERAASLVAQGMQPRVGEHHHGTQGRTVFLHHAQAGVAHPFMGDQRLFQHRQGDAFFFQLDDTVQAAQQFEAPIGMQANGVGCLFDMPFGQVL